MHRGRSASAIVLAAVLGGSCGSGSQAAAPTPGTAQPTSTSARPSTATVTTPVPTTAPPTATTVAAARPGAVIETTEEYARRGRPLPTRIFRPTGRGPYPLFVWAHGFDATVDYFAPMLRDLAARGYVVAAPTFPKTRLGGSGPDRYDDYTNQPADVSAVVDELLRRHPGLVDPARIGAGGHSLGAVTTRGLVADRCCLDRRVVAAVEVDGAQLPFPGGGAVTRGVPTLWIHGDADATFPVTESEAMYAAARPPKYLVVLRGAPHTPFRIPAASAVLTRTLDAFLDGYLRGDPAALGRLRTDATDAAT